MLQEPSQDGRPEAVVEHQREFGKLMQKERPNAKAGDIVTKPMRNIMRRLLASVFRGPDGREIKRSILDTFSGNPILEVNSTYQRAAIDCSLAIPGPAHAATRSSALRGAEADLLDPHGRLVVDIVEKVFP
jgi:hypothetical protein